MATSDNFINIEISRWNAAKEGFKTTQQPPPRKDFSMFMQLKIIGASKGFDNTDSATNQKNGKVEK